ncbi:MAG TPA: DnaB-like helicase C-terminal domain-containing protein, partial [Gemmata sp.]|nr:DnaB-like helicase C-terminal domain-containing protein [Gemmata sp.]
MTTDTIQTELSRIQGIERGLLSCVLQADEDAIDDAAELVGPEDFGFSVHGTIFSVCLELRATNSPITLVTVFERLMASGAAKDLGDCSAEWLSETASIEPTAMHTRYYAGLIRESADRRKFRYAAAEIQSIANQPMRSAADAVAESEQILFGLGDSQKIDQAVSAAELVRDGLEQIDVRIGRDEPDGLLTGFPDLDYFLGGLKPGNLVVVGARPSCGKTALAVAIATNAAADGIPIHFSSLEMSRGEITDRILSMKSGVPLKAIQTGRMPDGRRMIGEQIDRIQTAANAFRQSPFFLDDNPQLTAARLASIVRRAVRRRGVRLVVIDYLQLMYPESDREPRQIQVGTLARRVKQMARLCNVSVILLAQLNRESEKRSGSKPKLSDLRESGEIEAHADIALLLNPHAEQPNDNSQIRMIDVIVGKNR